MLKKAIRRTLRRILPVLGIRGRHTIADRIGKWAAPDPPIEMISINGVAIEIDHRSVSYTHLRAHETVLDLVCRLLLEKKKTNKQRAIKIRFALNTIYIEVATVSQ